MLKKVMDLGGVFLGVLIVCWANPLYASITIKPPSIPVCQGKSFSITVEIQEIEPIKGELFYRSVGTHQYQQLPLDIIKKGAISFTLPNTAVVAPGVEYYLKIADASDKVITSPSIYPEFNPYKIKVLESPAPIEFVLVSPDITVPVQGKTLSIIIEAISSDIALTKETVSMILDYTDITALATFSKDRITFTTDLLPEAGAHTILLTAVQPTGEIQKKSWTFRTVDIKDKEKAREIYARGNLSFNYGVQLKESSGSGGDNMSGNINLAFGAKGEDWEATWDGINIQYIKDNPGDEFTISSGFHFTLTKGEQFLEYGDITINETPLTAPSFARRGVQAKLKGFDTELHLFNVSTETLQGWKSGLGESDHQVYGLSLQRSLLSDGSLPVTLAYVIGENKAVSGFNTASTDNPSEGDVLGIALGHTVYDVNIEGEFASSRYDDDTSDNICKKDDIAGSVNLSTILSAVSLETSYFYYGPDFSSIANPSFTADREGVSANASTSFGPSTISVSSNRTRDNVKKDSARPIVNSTSGSISYGLSVAPWPSLNMSYSRSMQDSDREPEGTEKVENSDDTVDVGLSTSGKNWNMNLSSNYGKLHDKVGSLDSKTWGMNLSGGYTPFQGLSLSPSASYTESTSSGVTNDTRLGSLTANIPLWNPHLDMSFQVSHTTNKASDGSQDSTNLNGSWRLSLNLNQFIKKWFQFDGQQALALTVNYSRIEDHVTLSNTGDETSVFLSINLLSLSRPLDWSWGF